MGRSLDTYCYYGWYIGPEADLELYEIEELENYLDEDGDFDPDLLNKDLNVLEIKTSHYYDERAFFIHIKEVPTCHAFDGAPVEISKLNEALLTVENFGDAAKDIEKIQKALGLEIEGTPGWYVAPGYF